ncbi:MAG TPA: YfcC family protein [Anaerolineales bacterium]|nr:YfcC family protein [Anaerolineales bacterium]
MTAESSAPKKAGGLRFPSAFTILALLVVVVAILTFVIPAGKYDVNLSGEPIPGTYHAVAPNPQRWRDAVMAPINGMYGIQDKSGNINIYNSGDLYGAIDVALFILLIGGFLGVTMKTGAIDAGIQAVVRSLGQRGKVLITVLMVIFAAGGTSYGMAEESLAFYPLILAAMIALGYDALSAVALILLGAGIGVIGSTINPFATGIASGIAGIPLAEGIGYRIVILIAGTVAGIWYVRRYAARVQKDPSASYIADMKEDNEKHFLRGGTTSETVELTSRRKLILALFLFSFVAMIVGVIPWSDLGITRIATRWWWFGELSALFMIMGIVIGLVGGLGEKGTVEAYIDGARDLLGVALVVALARGISVIMTNGLIIDTVLYWCEQAVASLGSVAFINVMFLVYLPLSFLIPSSSGLATVTMPIMAPLAGFAGVPTHLVVTAYQSASGLLNLFTPTFAVVTGALAIGRINFAVWWKFVLPLVAILAVIVMLVLSAGVLIGA